MSIVRSLIPSRTVLQFRTRLVPGTHTPLSVAGAAGEWCFLAIGRKREYIYKRIFLSKTPAAPTVITAKV